ncbi:MAG: helix-turn-helix domain-containing protein [Phycisphaerales bacterium]
MTRSAPIDHADGVFVISTPRQLNAIASPVRQEIIEILMDRPPCTIAEIAEAMDRSPESLYHHMRRLQSIGLVRIAERRKARRQVTRVYEIVARDFRIDYSNRSVAFRRARLKAARSMWRRALRDLEATIGGDDHHARTGGSNEAEPSDGRIARDLVRLSDDDLSELQARIVELHEWLGEVDDPKARNRVSVTVAIARFPSD